MMGRLLRLLVVWMMVWLLNAELIERVTVICVHRKPLHLALMAGQLSGTRL